MRRKERDRKVWLTSVIQGKMDLKAAAEQMGVSYRQGKRILKKYREEGDSGLIHQSRGKEPNCAKSKEFKSKVLQAYEEHYQGFGPTFAAEKLSEREGLVVVPETLRGWLKAEGLWVRQRKRKPYRTRRERKARFGEMIQLDGSFHDWLGNGEEYCLMHMVDDATGLSLAELSSSGESLEAAFSILKRWIERYGVPQVLYVDRHSTYGGNPRDDETLPGQFGEACRQLGIRLIKARSPQAKGRVEKKHALYQDRFCKEIQLNQLKDLKAAQNYLSEHFNEAVNRRYTVIPRDPEDGHLPLRHDLYQTLVIAEERTVQNDFTLHFNGEILQLERTRRSGLSPKKKVKIKRHWDGKISVWLEDKSVAHRMLNAEEKSFQRQPSKQPQGNPELKRAAIMKGKNNSPWSRFNPSWLSA